MENTYGKKDIYTVQQRCALSKAMLNLKGCKVKAYDRTFSLKAVIISNP